MSRKQTLQQSECDHITKVVKWGYNLIDGDMVSYVELYGCTKCEETSDIPFVSDDFKATDHTKCGGPYECFGCKAKGLQLNTGDANGRAAMPKRKWEGELTRYKEARRQGIQPSGTTMEKIVAAEKASENLGRAYNAEKDPNAKTIDRKTANVINEVKKAGL
jgi:hypothetical protein